MINRDLSSQVHEYAPISLCALGLKFADMRQCVEIDARSVKTAQLGMAVG